MRIKKAVLLVLNNKTSGAFLSSNSVHATLNPIKVKGSVLTDSEIVSSATRAFTDTFSQSDLISLTVFFNRLFEGDSFDELDIVNITLSKAISDTLNLQDVIQLTQSKSIFDTNLTDEEIQKDVIKAFADIDAHVERLTLSLNKKFADVNLVNELLTKLFQKAVAESTTTGDIVSITASKQFSELVQAFDANSVSFTKNNFETQNFIERLILSTAKGLLDNNFIAESVEKSVDKAFVSPSQIEDVSSIQTTKSQSELLALLDSVTNSVAKAINEINTNTESTIFDVAKDLREVTQANDTPLLSLSKVTSDFFSIIDTIIVSLLKERSFSDSISYNEFNEKSVTKSLQDLGITFEQTEFNFSSVQSDSNSIQDTLSNFLSKVLGTDDVFFFETFEKTIAKYFENDNPLSDLANKDISKILENDSEKLEQLTKQISKILSGDESVTDDKIIQTVEKVLSDLSASFDLSSLNTTKNIQDVIQSTDNIIVNIVLVLILADLVNNISETSLNLSTVKQDNISFEDTLDKVLIKNRFINENDTQDYTDDPSYFLEDYVRSGISVKHVDSLVTAVTKSLQDVLSFEDVISVFSTVVKLLTDTFSTSETTTFALDKTLQDVNSSNDEISKDISLNSIKDFADNLDILSFDATKVFSDSTLTQDSVIVNIALVELLSDSVSYLSDKLLNFDKGVQETLVALDAPVFSVEKALQESVQLLDIINIVLIEVGNFSDEFQNSTSGRLVSQDYVESAGYVSETYFLEDYIETVGLYFLEDYVGESRILT